MKLKLLFTMALASLAIVGKAQQTCSVDISSVAYSNQSNKFQINITGSFTDTLSNSEYVMYILTENNMNGAGFSRDTFAYRSPNGLSHSFSFNRTFQYSYYGLDLKMEIIDTANNSISCTAFDVDSIIISNFSNCNASFNASSPAAGSLQVNFQNTSNNSSSVNSIDGYLWNFGDGTTSTQINPSHTYSTGGAYSVSLFSVRMDSVTLDTLCSSIISSSVTAGGVDTCTAGFYSSISRSNLSVSFNNRSVTTTIDTSIMVSPNYFWDFGDGNTSTQKDPVHTYAQPGTYQVTLIYDSYDSATQSLICSDTLAQNVNRPALLICTPQFSIDTVNSGSGIAYIINTSTVTQGGQSVSNINYKWSFGDGDSAYVAYPTHTYVAAGWYEVCLTISSYSGSQNCTSTFCDSIGMDSLGNILNKSGEATGFTLQVLDPSTIMSLNDTKPANQLSVYPNPVSDNVYIKGIIGNATYQVYSLNGMLVKEGELLVNKGISVGDLKNGLYLLNVQSDTQVETVKLQVRK